MKKKANATWLVMVIYLVIGGFCGYGSVSLLRQLDAFELPFGQYMIVFGALCVCIYAVCFLHIVIHEAGHMVFGMLTDYRFQSFRIGSFMWVKDGERFRFARFSLAGTGGQCLMSPPDLVDGRIPVVLYNLGGSMANVIIAVLSLALCKLTEAGILRMLLLTSGYIGIGFAVVNALPLHLGAVNNDGSNALELLKNPESIRAFWVQMKVAEYTAKGVRMKDMPEEWFSVTDNLADMDSLAATVAVMSANRLMDMHDFDRAEALMEQLLSGCSSMVGLHRSMILCDDMLCKLIREGSEADISALQQKEQKQMLKAMRTQPSVLRTQYAVALLHDHDEADAQKHLDAFEKAIKNYPYASDIESERELMEIIRANREENLQ